MSWGFIKGTYWYRNTETGEEKRSTTDPGAPWERGRQVGRTPTVQRRWYTNGIRNIQLAYGEDIPQGFQLGKIWTLKKQHSQQLIEQ